MKPVSWGRAIQRAMAAGVLLCIGVGGLEAEEATEMEQAEVKVIDGGIFTDHGRVCRNFRFCWPTAQLAWDAGTAREVLLVIDNAGRLMHIDYETGTTTPYPLPIRGSAWHAKVLADGRYWVGTGFGDAELLSFDPSTRTWLRAAARSESAPETKIICDLTERFDGCIYYASYPDAQLWRYDPATREHQLLLKPIDANNKYPYCIEAGHGGRIFIAMACDNDSLWCYDPADESLVNMTPEQYRVPGL